MALRQLLAVGAVQERQVRVERRLGAERLQDHQLARRVGDVVGAAHDVRDAHVVVVDGDREVVERAAVAARDDEVVDVLVLEGDLAADDVGHRGRALVRDPQADGALVLVGGAVLDEARDLLLVAADPLGLRDRALVPVELEPLERVEDLLDVLGRRALAVGVLDAQDERAARAAGQQPVVQCRARSTDVQCARR